MCEKVLGLIILSYYIIKESFDFVCGVIKYLLVYVPITKMVWKKRLDLFVLIVNILVAIDVLNGGLLVVTTR
jgi:hypothetical protein